MNRRTSMRWMLAAWFVGMSGTAAHAEPKASLQPPVLSQPERGNLAGAYASVTFEASDLRRGSFSLPSPFAVPGARGALLVDVFPTYSPDNGLGEWGVGWASTLSIRRWRASSDLDYQTDDLIGPWGRMVRGSDGAWYPQGLTSAIRVLDQGETLVALLPDGSRWTFGGGARVQTPKGTYEWILTEVSSVNGEVTRLQHTKNSSGRHYLQSVLYGGYGEGFQYQISFEYEPVPTHFLDFRPGQGLLLDQRVSRVKVLAKNIKSGGFEERWSYQLTYEQDEWAPAFYLKKVQRTFASGKQEPAFEYRYGRMQDYIEAAQFEPVPEMTPVLEALGYDAFFPSRATLVDINQDGRIDFEHNARNTLVVQTDRGFEMREIGAAAPDAYDLCRPSETHLRKPRHLSRLLPTDPEERVVVIEPDVENNSLLAVCSRQGELIYSQRLEYYYEPFNELFRLVDVNRDHKPDLVFANAGVYQIYPNLSENGGYRFGPVIEGSLDPFVGIDETWINDFNGDSIPDLIVREGASFFVWYGLGNFQFAPQGVNYPLWNLLGDYASVDQYSLFFSDFNRDGLADLFALRPGSYLFFINNGTDFVQHLVPTLSDHFVGTGMPVIADFAAKGLPSMFLTEYSTPLQLPLNAFDTGLMVRADDGKGNVLTFHYGSAPAEEGVAQRALVLNDVELENAGTDPLDVTYVYEKPRAHTKGEYLLGFDRVQRSTAKGQTSSTFENNDEVQGLLKATESVSFDMPYARFSSYDHAATPFRGMLWMKPTVSRSGLRAADRSIELAEETDFLTYEGLCPVSVQKTTAHGVLLTTTSWMVPAKFQDALPCISREVTEQSDGGAGVPAFKYRTRMGRNERGQLTVLEQVGTQGVLTIQKADYDEHGRLKLLESPGKGAVTAEYLGDTPLLTRTVGPDGVEARVESWDPVRDSILESRSVRGEVHFTKHFDYDGLERLSRTWQSFGGSSADLPQEEVGYEFPTRDLAGKVFVRGLLDAERASYKEALSLVGADGKELASLVRIPGAYRFAKLLSTNRTELESRTFQRSSLPEASARAPLRFQDLYLGVTELSLGRSSAVGASLYERNVLQQQGTALVQKETDFTHELTRGGLWISVRENRDSKLTARTLTDASGKVIVSEDQEGHGTTYTYDALGRLHGLQLPDGATHRVSFDAYGRVADVTRRGIGSIQYVYYPVTGLLQKKIFVTKKGKPEREVTFAYDSAGRVYQTTYTLLATGEQKKFTFEHDGLEAGPEAGQQGFLTAVRSDSYEKEISYNPDGSVKSTVIDLAGWLQVASDQTYYADGSVKRSRTTIWNQVENKLISSVEKEQIFNAAGQLTGLVFRTPDAQEQITLSYDAEGQLESALLPDAGKIQFFYDWTTRGMIGYCTKSPSLDFAMSWDFNSRGLIAQETSALGGKANSRAFTYTPRGYLAESKDSDQHALYSYSPNGLPSYTHDLSSERAIIRSEGQLQAGKTIYHFDDSGRVIQKAELNLNYNAQGHIRAAWKEGSPTLTEYVYDESGNRILKLQDGKPNLGYLGNMTLTESLVIEPVKVAGVLIGMLENGKFQSLAADIRGTLYVDRDGSTCPTTPYGLRSKFTSLSAAIDYAEKGYDIDIGTVRMGVRDYDPYLGQFLSPDPLFLEDIERCASNPVECNLYSYASDNPISYKDPSGKVTIIVHGTGARDYDWHKEGGDFYNAVQETFKEVPINFEWSGANDKQARSDAATNLGKLISSPEIQKKLANGEKLNIIAHSHGGNVAKEYSQKAGSTKIDVLVTLATPQRPDYRVDRNRVGIYLNAYSSADGVQTQGGRDGPTGYVAGAWRAVRGVWNTAGRTDVKAVNFQVDIDEGLMDTHSAMRSPQVWKGDVMPRLLEIKYGY